MILNIMQYWVQKFIFNIMLFNIDGYLNETQYHIKHVLMIPFYSIAKQ